MTGYLRYLRIAFSAACLIACVLLCALWVRSYWECDRFGRGSVDFASARGVAQFCKWSSPSYVGMRSRSHWKWDGFLIDDSFAGLPALRWHSDPDITYVNLPHWLLVLFAFAISATPWMPRQYSLRTLLITTTLVAMVLGLVVCAGR